MSLDHDLISFSNDGVLKDEEAETNFYWLPVWVFIKILKVKSDPTGSMFPLITDGHYLEVL
jgi:hypothetical protein